MSVAIAIKQNDKILVGSDSKVGRAGTRLNMCNPNNFKVFKVNGLEDCIMAVIGNYRYANVLKVEEDLIPEIAILKDQIDFDFVVTYLVPKIFDVLDEYSLLIKEQGKKRMMAEIIFAYKDRLFSISADGCVLEVDDYCAIGSGSSEAIGSLLSTEKLNSEERIKKAICASVVNDIFVDYPIILTNTNDDEVKIFMEKDINEKK